MSNFFTLAIVLLTVGNLSFAASIDGADSQWNPQCRLSFPKDVERMVEYTKKHAWQRGEAKDFDAPYPSQLENVRDYLTAANIELLKSKGYYVDLDSEADGDFMLYATAGCWNSAIGKLLGWPDRCEYKIEMRRLLYCDGYYSYTNRTGCFYEYRRLDPLFGDAGRAVVGTTVSESLGKLPDCAHNRSLVD